MSILHIGQSSRFYQCTPGRRGYINPFLSPEQKSQLLIKKQQNQQKYRQVLLQQIKQRQKNKKQQQKKIIQLDLKHQRDFYTYLQKIKQKSQLDQIIIKNKQKNNQNNRNNHLKTQINDNQPQYSRINIKNNYNLKNNYHYNNSQLKNKYKNKSNSNSRKQISYLQQSINNSRLNNSNIKYGNHAGEPNYNMKQSSIQSHNNLINHSLIQLGNRLRLGAPSSSFADYGYFSLSSHQQSKKMYKQIHTRQHEEMRQHLNQRIDQVYEMLNKSKKIVSNNTKKVNYIKKRLKTQPLYLLDDIDEEIIRDQVSYKMPKNNQYNQNNKYNYYNEQEYYYQLPQIDYPNQGSRLTYYDQNNPQQIQEQDQLESQTDSKKYYH